MSDWWVECDICAPYADRSKHRHFIRRKGNKHIQAMAERVARKPRPKRPPRSKWRAIREAIDTQWDTFLRDVGLR